MEVELLLMLGFIDILSLTGPLFIIIALGFFTVRFGACSQQNVKALAWFTVNIAVPAALLKTLSSQTFEEIFHHGYLLVYGLGSLLVYILLYRIARFLGKTSIVSALFGLGASASNSMMIGYPIVYQLFGEAALIPFTLTLLVENLVVLPLTLILANRAQHRGKHFIEIVKPTMIGLVKSPIIIAISVGMSFACFEIQLSQPALTLIEILASTVVGVSLFAIGGSLAGDSGKASRVDICTIATGKLLLHPCCVFIALLVLAPIPALYQQVAIILAAMPMFTVFAAIGMQYGQGKLCSSALLPTTLLSFATINIAIWLL